LGLVVDPATGDGTEVGSIGYKLVGGLSFTGGALYGVTMTGELLLIDLVTGQATKLKKFLVKWMGAS